MELIARGTHVGGKTLNGFFGDRVMQKLVSWSSEDTCRFHME
jgi:hypothetical protein